ncbi:MAG: tagaturonate epimerase family protein [Verrucomicrobia bacterium]|nr:tagaturonate epimerase family protein [Verrucomicrobiota bacterium]
MKLPMYSFGTGDRFGRQGAAQLRALVKMVEAGIEVAPVWNKSNREHSIIGTTPDAVRVEADAAVAALQWHAPYFVDADHIGLKTVDGFLASSDFFTIDVADFTGVAAPDDAIAAFVEAHARLIGPLQLPGRAEPLVLTEADLRSTATRYLTAIREAGNVYRHIAAAKGAGQFVTEVSIDETHVAQTPGELLVILAAMAAEGIPAQTVAPKFTGEFHKGVDYIGDAAVFQREFNDDLAVIRFAIAELGLPADLKLSVHSGSDKFSLYGIIGEAIRRNNAGLHIKTAGTTWLEELIGLAEAGGAGLDLAKTVYREAHGRFDELAAPYATVVDIDRSKLPSVRDVDGWDAQTYASALRHVEDCPTYNPNLRQLLHIGYKVAAEMGATYLDALDTHADVIGRNVTENFYERHLARIFLAD